MQKVPSCIGSLLLTFVSITLSAQISLGLKAGGNLVDTYQTGTKYFASSPNFGFHTGIYGDYNFNGKLFARIEALFSTRGFRLSAYQPSERIEYERQSSYLDFPVSANYNIWRVLNIHAGLVPSLFIEEYRSITKTGDGLKVDAGDQFKSYERWQFGGFVGASYPVIVSNQNIEVGARYSMAISGTNELIRGERASRDPRYMMLQLYLAYKIFDF